MDEMPSSEFRRRYASLTARTVVTVNGHPIGEWVPVNAPVYRMTEGPRFLAVEDVEDGAPVFEGDTVLGEPPFNSRPFTPVPKGK